VALLLPVFGGVAAGFLPFAPSSAAVQPEDRAS